MAGEHRVWFTRFGVQHYYLATSRDDADRWIRVYREIGGEDITIDSLETPDGTRYKVSGQSSLAGSENN